MNAKDIIIIVLLLAVIAAIFFLMKAGKIQTGILVAVARKTGALSDIDPEVKSSIAKNRDEDSEEDEEKSSKAGKRGEGAGAKKSTPKKIHKELLSLFKDEIPKTTSQIKDLHKKTFNKETTKHKINNTLWYMVKMGLIGTDKGEGKINFWGPAEWFDKEGLMYEDYLEKVSKA